MFKKAATKAMEFISTARAPPPAAPYSQAIKANGFLHISGQVPLTPENKMVEGDIQAKSQQCFDNLRAILQAGGCSPKDIVKINIYTNDITNFKSVNEVYVKFFEDHRPARSFVAVKALPLNADVEIEATALVPENN
ncbi:isoleucine biosynthesis protein [Starmerella bacillaris]|uniref:Isoleucine biosynthesis protein n=1 Tax=Starmerella bacillaris TaxID=1247836 RepID=A0AAV5RRP3_STABA|nr:isoleucine biosynthesis protein [Starmerella bacillaris]